VAAFSPCESDHLCSEMLNGEHVLKAVRSVFLDVLADASVFLDL